MKTISNAGLNLKTNNNAGSNRSGLKVKAAVKAGGFGMSGNHNRAGLSVKTAIKSGLGAFSKNHSVRLVVAR